MTSAEQVIERIEVAGGELTVCGDRIRCRLPEDAAHLLDDLKAHKTEVIVYLKRRNMPPMPEGVRLLEWNPKPAPVILTTASVVTDVDQFICATLDELGMAMKARPATRILRVRHARRLRDLADKLEQVGVTVKVERGW